MRAPTRFARQGSRLFLAFGLSGLAAASCERKLEGAPCPCVDGWTCCPEDNRCYASQASCRSNSESGGAGGVAGATAGSHPGGGDGGETGGPGGSANPSGGGGAAGTENGGTAGIENGGTAGIEDGGTAGTQDGGTAGHGEGGVSGEGDGGNDGGTVGPPRDQAMLPRFCNSSGWCGERNPFHAVWGFEATDVNHVWVVGRTEAEFGDTAFLHWDGRRWLNTPHILLGPDATVNAIWGTGPEDVWFVGAQDGQAIAVHWEAGYWSLPFGVWEIPEFRAVSGIGRNNVWAVGAQGGVARWNGAAWSHFPSAITADLNAIWNDGPELWAVGASGTVARWDGRGAGGSLTQEVVADVDLNAVWGRSMNDVWVAGDAGTLMHFDGSEWSRVEVSNLLGSVVDIEAMTGTPLGVLWLTTSDGRLYYLENEQWRQAPGGATHRLNGVWAASNGEVWAVGDAGASVHLPSGAVVSLRGAWVRSPEPVASDLFGVWAAAANDLWAVGSSGAVMRWNGNNWTRASAPETQGNWTAVTGTSSNDVWIVGSRIVHFDGGTWAVYDESSVMLRSVCAVGPDDAWAVGDAGVILHFDGSEWLPSESFPDMNLKTVWCGTTDDVWAIDAIAGVLHWDGQSWLEMSLPDAGITEVRSGQILVGSAPDDVWVLSQVINSDAVYNTDVTWLRTNLWNGDGDWIAAAYDWSWGIAEAAHPTGRGEFWIVGSGIWHAPAGFPAESYIGIGATIHGVWAPRETPSCGDDPDVSSIGPIGAWAVGSSGTLLEKQCIRDASYVAVD